MNVYRVKTGSILPLGKQGENLARKIQFDISRWISTFGPGTVQLLHQRRGDEAPYPVAVEREGNFAVWTVTNADTAAPGTGHAELQYYVGDALAKSETWMTKVFPALGPAGETPPEAQQGWVDQVLAQVARITGMTAQAVELPAGSAPTADYADGVLTIGIPLGGDVSEAQIAQAVAEYLSKNPIEETDPTVPAWAKEEKKPSYTAAEVGADPSGTAASQVSAHNAETTAHNDMRLLIQSLTDRLNALVDSDDTTLDQLSEIVAYIKGNRELIAAITTDKVGVGDIVNDLVTNVANKPLSAAQGVALKALIDAIRIPEKLPNPNALIFTGAVEGSYDGSAAKTINIPSGGGKAWKCLRSFTLPKDPSSDTSGIIWTMCNVDGYTDQIATFEFSTDENGNNFSIREVFLIMNMAYGKNENYFGLSDQNGDLGYGNLFSNRNILGGKSSLTRMALYVRSIGTHVQGILTTADNYEGHMAGNGPNKNKAREDEDITKLKFGTFLDNSILPGSSFEFWGR